MNEFPLGYERVPPTTWAYLSSLLLLAVYFKFNRIWSVRNIDLLLIILLAPGLLFVHFGAIGRERIRVEIAAELSQSETSNGSAQSSGTGANDPAASSIPTPDATAELVDGQTQLLRESLAVDTEASGAAVDPRLQAVLLKHQEKYSLARQMEHRGYLWLFMVSSLILIRMLIDPMLVRRPMLDPNLSSGGLTFMGSAMLLFMIANLLTASAMKYDLYYVPEVTERMSWAEAEIQEPRRIDGPGYRFLSHAPLLPMLVDTARRTVHADDTPVSTAESVMTRVLVIASLLSLIVAMVLIGSRHFENFWMGAGVATLFLMLPYTVQMSGRIGHVLPASLLLWAIFVYRLPFLAGMFLGAASGLIYYPLLLLPLWLSFYSKRGWLRFSLGLSTSLLCLLIALWLFGDGQETFWQGLRRMFGLWLPRQTGLGGIWALGWEPVFRLPMIAGVVAIAGSLAIWPSRKNLGTLISGTCAVMIGVQFWDGYQGGLSMGWFLPLALLAIFRPNTEDKTADRVVPDRTKIKSNTSPSSS